MRGVDAVGLQIVQGGNDSAVPVDDRATQPLQKRRIGLRHLEKRLAQVPKRDVDLAGKLLNDAVGNIALQLEIPVEGLHEHTPDIIVAVRRGEAPRPRAAFHGEQDTTPVPRFNVAERGGYSLLVGIVHDTPASFIWPNASRERASLATRHLCPEGVFGILNAICPIRTVAQLVEHDTLNVGV